MGLMRLWPQMIILLTLMRIRVYGKGNAKGNLKEERVRSEAKRDQTCTRSPTEYQVKLETKRHDIQTKFEKKKKLKRGRGISVPLHLHLPTLPLPYVFALALTLCLTAPQRHRHPHTHTHPRPHKASKTPNTDRICKVSL